MLSVKLSAASLIGISQSTMNLWSTRSVHEHSFSSRLSRSHAEPVSG